MDPQDDYPLYRTPTAARPLLGLTVLVVEDSRFACEAMRLLCLRSGARIRRADCLSSARRHLQIYRPSVVVIDLGLPDGSGIDLIEELARANPRVGVLLATSGDDRAAEIAIAAGADGFLAKPIVDLGTFQESVLSRLPADRHPVGPRKISHEVIKPDTVAYDDDMAHAADLLGDADNGRAVDYIAHFLSGVARSADDLPLQKAADSLIGARAKGSAITAELARVAGLVQERIRQRQVV